MKVSAVGVFCSSSDLISPVFLEEAHMLGQLLAEQEKTIVYGGAQCGAMGALARGALENGGRVVGVYPSRELGHETSHENLSEMIQVDTMAERKHQMFERSDGFIIFPGGIGTLDEVFELIVLRTLHQSSPNSQLGMHEKPVVFYNPLGFWNPLFEALEIMIQQKFVTQSLDQMFSVTEDLSAIPKSLVPLLKK